MDKVQHFEITADNMERAKKFYREVFGWGMKDYPEMEYVMLHTGKTDENGMMNETGFINGGMRMKGKEIKSPVITISVKDIDKTMRMIKKHNGKVIEEKMQVGDMGYAAYFKDSEGNILGLFEYL